jgi:hypothetical protein
VWNTHPERIATASPQRLAPSVIDPDAA